VDEALAVGMEQIFTPASAAAGRRLLQEELEKERQGLRPRDAAYRLAMDMVHKNGSIVPTEINYNVIYGADSRPAAVLGVIRDVSEQHRVESALRESEDRFSLFINYCPAAVYIKDGEGRLLVASRHFETIFRRPLAELIGQPNEAVAPTPEIARRWRLEEETVLQTGQGREIAEEVNGRHYATWKFPIFRPDKPALIGGFSLDVTDQKLAQQQLVQAQKMETVGRLAGGIAHDFNNLLQTILGFSELLLAGMAEGDARCEDLQEIQRAAQRAALLTSQLLAFSRKQMIHTETVPLNALVQDSSRMLQRLIGEDIQLHLIPDKDLWPVRVDRGQFGQILMNLVINARDAMPHGGRITITTANVTLQKEDVHVFPEAQEGRYVCLAITDTGTGMTRDVMAHLFEPFFTTKGIGKGTGMGLPMVYGLAKQHGGWINAYSEVGSGSTFKLYLPAAPADEHAARPAAPAEGSRDTPGRGERILLVEDDAGVRALAILILQTRGYTVFSAADTQSALSIFEREQGRFDLLFSDVVLHDTTGIELAEMLQTRRPDLRVLMTSGYTDDRSRWPLIAERNWGFLQKPFATQALLQAVRRQLDQPPAAAAPPG